MANISIFSSIQAFEDGQRIAKSIMGSDLVPTSYKNNPANTLIALEIANRIGVSPFMVMQNLDIIKGKPSWSSTFIISAINSCGKFSPLRFEFSGEGDEYGCEAVATDLSTGEPVRSPKVTWKMVKAEGWLQKTGSKWKTMPELMFRYRSASFFGRLYTPEILNGMQSVEEMLDIAGTVSDASTLVEMENEIKELLMDETIKLDNSDREAIENALNERKTAKYGKILTFLKSKKDGSL